MHVTCAPQTAMRSLCLSLGSAALLLLFHGAVRAQEPASPSDRLALAKLGPPPGKEPVVLTTEFHLQDIDAIDDETETIQFSGTLVVHWHDPRQLFNPDSTGVREKFFSDPYQYNELFPTWIPQVDLLNAYAPLETRSIMLRITPSGDCALFRSINGTAKVKLELHRYPFDDQRIPLTFHTHGLQANEVRMLSAEGSVFRNSSAIRIPQWNINGIDVAISEVAEHALGKDRSVSALVVSLDVTRDPFHMLRLVILPLALIVILSWSVFWMDRSSLGDRMSVSFVGILTAVTYQVIIADTLPDISYLTFIHGFVNLSFMLMCLASVVNLLVSECDKRNKPGIGDRIDTVCRWAFPAGYVLLLTLNWVIFQ